jgi:hypothetical protein
MQKASDQPPSCYGKMWSGTEKECVGGLDATYTDANGRHIRPPCDYQESCSIRTQAGRNVVPASSLTRPQPTNSTPEQTVAAPTKQLELAAEQHAPQPKRLSRQLRDPAVPVRARACAPTTW